MQTDLEKVTEDAYVSGNRDYVRVTRVLSILAKYELLLWYGKNGTKYCQEVQRKSKEFGTKMHKYFDMYITGRLKDETGLEADVQLSLMSFKDWVSLHKITPIKTEYHVLSRENGYGGTMDILAKMGDNILIGDWKTGKNIYPEYTLQVGAYWGALKEQDNIDADGAFIVSIHNGIVKDMFVDRQKLKEAQELFLSALKLYYWLKKDNSFNVR